MEEDTKETTKTKGGNPIAGILFKIVLVLVVAAAGAGGTFYVAKQYPQVLGLSKTNEQAQAEVDQLLSEVGKLIALPTDEKPTIATVSDVEKIKDQPFFKNAQNGDRVIIYTTARKAILYRPSEKKIMDVGAVNIQQRSPEPSGTPGAQVTPRPTVAPTESPSDSE